MNPMLQNLNRQGISQILSPFKQTMGMLKACGNPQMMLNQMLGNNPQYQQAMKYIQENGGDAQKAFYKMSQEMGVDPNDILNELR